MLIDRGLVIGCDRDLVKALQNMFDAHVVRNENGTKMISKLHDLIKNVCRPMSWSLLRGPIS